MNSTSWPSTNWRPLITKPTRPNGFKMKHLGDYDLTLETKPEE